MTLENQNIIQKKKNNRCYPLIFVGANIAVGSMSNLIGSIPGQAHSFTSCQLLVKDEH